MKAQQPMGRDVDRPAPSGPTAEPKVRLQQPSWRHCRGRSFINLLLALTVLARLGAVSLPMPSPTYIAGALLVKWKDGPKSYAATLGNQSVGAEVERDFREIGWQRVRLPLGMTVAEGIAAYRRLDTVEAVEPDYAVQLTPPVPPDPSEGPTEREPPSGPVKLHSASPPSTTPNDPRYNSQWNLRKIGMPTAWNVTTGSSNVVVAVIDTGVNYLHQDLAANMWRNLGETGVDDLGRDKASDGVDDDANGYVDDVYGIDPGNQDGDPMDRGYIAPPAVASPYYHGTQVAGIIGAVGNNGKGVAGINWSIQLMALKNTVGGDTLDPAVAYTEWNSYIIECVDYILKMKRRGVNVRVVNNSYYVFAFSQALQDGIRLCGDEGILFACAAGNQIVNTDNLFANFPAAANLPNVLSVAASDENDNLFSLSNYGQTTVDLAAPGVNIPTTGAPGSSAYSTFQWTSSATPHVAGAAALLWSAKPDATLDEVTAALLGSVDRPASLREKVRTNGRLNVSRALQVLTNANTSAIVLHAFPHNFRTEPTEPLRVHFSKAMNQASVEAAFQLTPAASGHFTWSGSSFLSP